MSNRPTLSFGIEINLEAKVVEKEINFVIAPPLSLVVPVNFHPNRIRAILAYKDAADHVKFGKHRPARQFHHHA